MVRVAELASEGWYAGSWPYIIFAVARSRDVSGELFGYGTYVEGDTSTHWFRSQDACFEAITVEVFFHWAPGQSDGPDSLPAQPRNCRTRVEALPRLRPAGARNCTPTDVDNIIEIPTDDAPRLGSVNRPRAGTTGTAMMSGTPCGRLTSSHIPAPGAALWVEHCCVWGKQVSLPAGKKQL